VVNISLGALPFLGEERIEKGIIWEIEEMSKESVVVVAVGNDGPYPGTISFPS
jgi:hypothetical protein